MNRILFFAITIFFVCSSFANTIVDKVIKLPKHFKVENTFSGNLSNTKSFHLVFSKNKKNKQYTIHSYLFDGKNVEAIKPIENDKEYQVISFHQQDNMLTLLLSFKKKKDKFLRPVSINLETKKVIESEPIAHEDFSTSFREKNRSVLIYETDDKLTIKEFVGASQPTESELVFSGKKDIIKKYLKDNSIVPVKTNEFVKNGAVSSLKGYLTGKNLLISKDNDNDNTTQVLNLNFSTKKIEPSGIKNFTNLNGEKEFKKFTSYINNDKLYQLGLNKKNGKIKISDIKSNKTTNTIDLNASLTSKIKGNKDFQGMENFLKNAGKNKYKATITVNNTNENKVRVRVDYVDKTYNYHYNWWWHHTQFMMWQQQQMMMNHARMSVPSGFGPRQPNDFAFEIASVENEKRYFELVIDVNGQLVDGELPNTIYKEIDKKQYIDKLEDVKDIKHESSCFLKDEFRYIGYSKKIKAFVFQTNKIK